MNKINKNSLSISIKAALALALLTPTISEAASYTLDWDGEGGGASWVTATNWNPDTVLTSADTVTLSYNIDFSATDSNTNAALAGIDVAGITFGALAKGNISAGSAGVGIDLVGDITNNSADVIGVGLGANLLITTDSALRTITNNGTSFVLQSDFVVGSGGLSVINAAAALQSGGVGINFGASSQFTGSGAVSFVSNDIDSGLNLESYILVGADLDMTAGSGNTALTLTAGTGSSVRLTGTSNSYTGITNVTTGIVYIDDANSLGASGAGNQTNIAANSQVQIRGTGSTNTYTVNEIFNLTGAASALQTTDAASFTNVTLTGAITLTANGSVGSGAVDTTMTLNGAISHAANTITFTSGGAGGVTNINNTVTGTSGVVLFQNAGTVNLNADLTSTGATDLRGGVTVNTSALIDNIITSGQLNSFNGTLNLNSNNSVGLIQQGNATVGGAIADINIATGKTLTMGGNYTYLVRETANTVATIDGGTLALGANRTFTIGDDIDLIGAESTISSVISGAFSLTKLGVGTLALNGVNTYSGGTVVSAGVLDINGTVAGNVSTTAASILNIDGTVQGNITAVAASSAVRVNTGAIVEGNTTLAAAGIISGTGTLGNSATDTVTISAGALNPGGSSLALPSDYTTNGAAAVTGSGDQVGTLTVNADLTTSGTGVINIQLNAANSTSDKITGIDLLTLANDSVVLSNIGGSFFDGQTFDLFDFASIGAGSAVDFINSTATGVTQESLTVLGPDNGIFANESAYWDYSNFSTTGSITFRIVPSFIPEPSKALFVGLGAAVLLLRRRRKVV